MSRFVAVILIVVASGAGYAPRVAAARPSGQQTAQQPTGGPQAQPAPPSAALLKQVVAFLVLKAHQGQQQLELRGTAFFVIYEDKRLGDQGGFVYLVTNRHVVEPSGTGGLLVIDKTSLRLNLRSPVNGKWSEEA